MQSTAPMLYAKSSVGVSYSTDPGVRIFCGSNSGIVAASASASANINNNSNVLDEIKLQFFAPEGLYKQMTISDYNSPPRVSLNQTVCPISNTLVRVSFVKVFLKKASGNGDENNENKEDYVERICFNSGREIYVYDYGSVQNPVDLTNPIDKRVYKGTSPTCHDFNQETASLTSSTLLIGFTAGQIQLFDPYQKEAQSKLFNEDRLIDKSPVTFIRWIPGQTVLFAVSYASGSLYIYNEEHLSSPNPPVYQLMKQGEGFSTFSCKSKTPRNPIQKWSIGHGPINQFEFSGKNGKYLATVGQDGFLRIFNFKSMELIGFMKSYFGGLLCLAWSPDLRLIVTGGEDDMLTVYSVAEERVVCRGQGHKSWVSQVAFDPCMSVLPNSSSSRLSSKKNDSVLAEISDAIDDFFIVNGKAAKRNAMPIKATSKILPISSNESTAFIKKNVVEQPKHSTSMEFSDSSNYNSLKLTNQTPSASSVLLRAKKDSFSSSSLAWIAAGEKTIAMGGTDAMKSSINSFSKPSTSSTRTCYRIGSVGFDTQLCLWDLPGDILCEQDQVGSSVALSASPTSPNLVLIPSLSSIPSINGKSNKVGNGNTTVISIGLTKSLPREEASSTNNYDQHNFSKALTPLDVPTEGTSIAIQSHTNTKNKFKKLHKRGLLFGSRLNDRWSRHNGNSSILNGHSTNSSIANEVLSSNGTSDGTMSLKRNNYCADEWSKSVFGTAQCPRMEDVPVIEPLVCKKIAHDRLTILHFRENCLVTACQEGFILTWARPEKAQHLSLNNNHKFHTNNKNDDFNGTCV